MPIPQRPIGKTGVSVGAIGHGLMMLTWTFGAPVPSDAQAFASMKAAADAGATNWNTGSFYGNEDPKANLKLLNRFFEAYPEYADRIFLSVKGGGRDGMPTGPQTEDVLREDLAKIQAALGDRKKIDLYELARQISPVEETVPVMAKLQAEGLFGHIGLSEVSARSVRAAAAIAPIAMVEVECSLWSMREAELKAVIAACEELDIAIAGYSPLGRGLLTTPYKSFDEVPASKAMFDGFSKENFPINLELVHALRALGEKRSVPPAQLALAYLLKLSPVIIPIPGSSNEKRALENIEAANVEMTQADFDDINAILAKHPGAGERYTGHLATLSWA